jgi:phosphatidylglycerophosphatase A
MTSRLADRLVLWLAEGFGSGRLPAAPGTWGSVLGVIWFGLLILTGSLTVFIAGTAISIGLAVPLCTRAERILRRHDPGSVVLDEIVAVPLCYAGWLTLEWLAQGSFPSWTVFFKGGGLGLTLAGFALFRLLDALKPPPIGMCQRLPAGWGVVADDLMAALLTGLIVTGVRCLWQASAT